MKTVKDAIEEITYESDKFPREAFQIISENRREATPYLYEAIEKAVKEKDNLEDKYLLHFYAMYFLGEFQDKNAFPKLMELASLPSGILDYLIGDGITEGLSDILYNTYNGNLELLKETIWNEDVDDFARSAMLSVMGQLYLDGTLAKEEWQSFIKEIVYHEACIGDYIYAALASAICQCHMVDMLPDIRYLYKRDLIDEMVIGNYDDCVDDMFQYRKNELFFCKNSMNTAEILKSWAMFTDNEKTISNKQDYNDFIKELQIEEVRKNLKTGRNDPCPCGSGKKYKNCCLNKPKSELDAIEREPERRKWLERYPETGKERQEGRIYLEDYYDAKSIEIDQILYLALMNRPHPIWKPVPQKEADRKKRLYLWNAFIKFKERAESEEIGTFDEYDAKYAIHYQCYEWMLELLELLDDNGDYDKYREVRDIWNRMSAN